MPASAARLSRTITAMTKFPRFRTEKDRTVRLSSRNSRKEAMNMDNEKTSYLMLFCALLLVRKSRMGLQDLAQIYPFRGDAQSLVEKLVELEA